MNFFCKNKEPKRFWLIGNDVQHTWIAFFLRDCKQCAFFLIELVTDFLPMVVHQ